MGRTTKWSSRLSIVVAVGVFSACGGSGPAGPAGATGATGATGTNGTAGTNGTTGTNGTNGQNCTVTDYDGGVTVSCPGSNPVNIPDGNNGASCIVTQFDGGATVTCPGSAPVTVLNGVNAGSVADFTTLSASEIAGLDLTTTVTSVSSDPRPVVELKITDQKGRGITNLPAQYFKGFAILKLVPGNIADGGNGLNIDTWVSYLANCSTCIASSETASATSLLSLGDGRYTYTFTKNFQAAIPDAGSPGTSWDPAAPHRLLFRIAPPGNPFRPLDVVYEWVPATGAKITGANEKVSTANCLECHGQFRANALNAGGSSAFHGGSLYEVPMCFVCHNDQRKYSGTNPAGNPVIAEPTIVAGVMTPPAGQTRVKVLKGEAVINLPVWIHKIHRGEGLALSGPYPGGSFGDEINHILYPQDIRNCTKCHKNAPLANNWKDKPSRRACGSCHDAVDFTAGTNHLGGPQANDAMCSVCHTAALVAAQHLPIVPPDPNNYLVTDGGNYRTNAGWLGNPRNRPDGGAVISYVLPTGAVTTVPGADGGVYPSVKFRMLRDGANVVFNTYDGGTGELVTDFYGSSSIQCVYAVPQDGIPAPGDFNGSASAYLKSLWKGSAGTLTGPDSTGNYTGLLTGVNIPATATMLTCGVGYNYDLKTTHPLTQTNLAAYPFDPVTKAGGLVLPALNIWQVATGYLGRRGATSSTVATGQVVATAKCESCHNPLGVSPSFHVGQRNDGASCAFCHNANRTSFGWSANAGTYIHAIHGAAKRTVPFNWRASSTDTGFFDVTFPGRPQNCETCHTPGYYDFSAPWYTTSTGFNQTTRQYTTVATGTYNKDPVTNPTGWFAIAPYVTSGVNYGAGFSYNATTQVTTEAAPTTLVNSPITASCFGCHDSTMAMGHMENNGGSIYQPRSTALSKVEQCLICHGPGKIAAIKEIHYQ